MEGALLPIVVFLAVYVALTFELVNTAVAALLGVMILIVLHAGSSQNPRGRLIPVDHPFPRCRGVEA